MDGFFVTIDFSKILDSNETSYKIFIDKNEMSVVYELIEWIRFVFSLERCIFLIHENSVIHELEDIKVLEILKTLEIRPCLRSICIHSKMEKALLSKLNLFVYWNGMRVHKLFGTRCKFITQNQQNYLNISDKPNNFLLKPQQNVIEEIDKSKLSNNQHLLTVSSVSPSRLIDSIEIDKIQVNEIQKQDDSNGNQLDLKTLNTSVNESTHLISNNLNLFSECSVQSSKNKKQKIQSESKNTFTGRKNQRKTGIPFSLGALLSEIREKARNQEFTEKHIISQTEKSLTYNESSLKRKRKRKHKKSNLKLDSNQSQTDLFGNDSEPSAKVKPNHIRFSDTDETVLTEANEFHSKSLDQPEDISLEVLDTETPQMLTAESIPSVEECKSSKIEPLIMTAQVKVSEKLINQDSEKLYCAVSTVINTDKKQPDNFQQNLFDINSLKENIKHPKICTRFY